MTVGKSQLSPLSLSTVLEELLEATSEQRIRTRTRTRTRKRTMTWTERRMRRRRRRSKCTCSLDSKLVERRLGVMHCEGRALLLQGRNHRKKQLPLLTLAGCESPKMRKRHKARTAARATRSTLQWTCRNVSA